MKFITVDMQGFTIDNRFTPKEIVIYDGTKTSHYMFKSPKPFSSLSTNEKNQVKYLERNHHCLQFNSGYLDYCHLRSILQKQLLDICNCGEVQRIYVKGHQKKQFLQEEIFNNLQDLVDSPINIIDMACVQSTFNFSKGYPYCFGHRHYNKPCMCAIKNCYDLHSYLCNLLPL